MGGRARRLAGESACPTSYTEVVGRANKTFTGRAAEYMSLALVLPASTFVGYLIGYWLDRKLGTQWLQILFLILGSVAGFVQLIRQIMRDSRDDRA